MRGPATWTISTALLLVAGAGGWWAWSSVARPGADPADGARAAYEGGDFERAAGLARERLRADRGDRRAALLLARSYARLGDADSARRVYGRVDRAAMEAEDLYLLGEILRREGRPDEARAAFELALADDPSHAEATAALMGRDFEQGRFERVLGGADRLDGRPGWEAFSAAMRGRAELALLDPRGAARSLDRALRLDPTPGRAPIPPDEIRKDLARAHLGLGRGDLAGPVLKAVDPPDAESLWLAGRAGLQRGEIDAAISSRTRARSLGVPEDPMRVEPAPYVGSDRCVDCHPAIVRDQQSSSHARTFHPDPEPGVLPLPDGPVPDPIDPEIVHRIRAEGGAIVFETEAEGDRSWARVLHVLGSGTRGMTPVGVDEQGRVVELRLSHYGEGVGWGRTTGHPEVPETPGAWLGLPLSAREQRACLDCHTTNFREAGARAGPTLADGAIGCERCHGPAGNHLMAVDRGFPDPAIARPRLATAGQVVGLCGDCHRPPSDAPLPESSHPSAVRFQAATFVRSPCFARAPASAKFDCVSCHDPHRDAEHEPRHYEEVCLSCHPGPAVAATGPPSEATRSAPCPINPSRGCIDCHMPRRPSVMEHTEFTDHHIRAQPD
ncbi:tetratricopeptide repeat protein [Tautonia plasticadhaerens]|uniref:Tetratricopeptide repeat protein n=1 Tax=Tautonia plasticadhaerens TaxID=2527974 RepID=A0A518HB86_9BACT|nr:tetratricopeptide repeat protein [Tautonia plasticadhaerens]QDV37976.1 Tetratricopeptide repeat protein [Tautonia plasticadhaerens]